MNKIIWTFIFGTSTPNYSSDLMERARVAAIKAMPIVSSNRGIIVLDRYGIEAEVMQTCQRYHIPLLVIGKSARPISCISMKHYERAILSKGTPQYMQAQLIRYALLKSEGVVIIGDSPDCRAMRVYAGLVGRNIKHVTAGAETAPYSKFVAPPSEWIKTHGHYYLSA